MSLQAALDSCRAALEGVDEAAIDAPAARLLELLGHQVPDSFESHRVAFLEAFGDALYAEGDEPKVRAAIGRFASQLSLGPRLFEEFGDDWTPVPPPREWLIHSWLPAWRLAMLTGDPGAGKSRLCVQMAVAIACGRSRWLAGEGPLLRLDDPACVVFATYEDEREHIQRLLHQMKSQALVKKRFRYICPFGALWGPDPAGSRHTSTLGALTPHGAELRAYCEARSARLLVLDAKASVFALNENDRALVRAFLADWDRWACTNRCSILLISHPPKGDSDYSGSTDWEAAPRAVWVLDKKDTGTGQEVGEGRRAKREAALGHQLWCLKTSYARKPAPMWLAGYPDWKVVSPEDAAADVRRLDSAPSPTPSNGAPAMPHADVSPMWQGHC